MNPKWAERAESLKTRLFRRDAHRESLEDSWIDLEKELESLGVEQLLTEKSEEVLSQISTKVLGGSVSNLSKLVTAGLSVVFPEKDLVFLVDTSKSRGKTAVTFDLQENGRSAPIRSAYGGGVLVIVGVLIRCFVIMSTGLGGYLIGWEVAHYVRQRNHWVSPLHIFRFSSG